MKNVCLIYLLFISTVTGIQPFGHREDETKRQDYIIQIQNDWIHSVKLHSQKFGLTFKRKLVSNIFLFAAEISSTGTVSADIKGFKEYFGDKIEHIKQREKAIIKYHTWENRTTENPTFEQWVVQPMKLANNKQCWPYYGMNVEEAWLLDYTGLGVNVAVVDIGVHVNHPDLKRNINEKCWPYYGMNVEQAWSLGYTGLGVNVAVVDIGVHVNHPDLKRNIDMSLSYSFVDQNHSFVSPKRFVNYIETDEVTSHGTMAAGLIVGEFGNQHCSAGVAFNAKLAALKVFQLNEEFISWPMERFTFSVDKISSALAHKMENIDIYSCSFNIHDKFISATTEMRNTLEEGVLKGRKGKGNIYVFSAGNGKGRVYDCNMEAFANSIYTITISSVGKNGSKPSYVIPCATTLASTYGEYNTFRGDKKLETTSHDGKCGHFKGTSASTALASGIIALTLQANPNLTWRDVQHIIILSSSHVRLEDHGQTWKNAAGLTYNSFFGFGLMNATAMVLLAKDWSNVPPQKQTTVYETNLEKRLFREDALAVTVQIDLCEQEENCVRFSEHVQVNLNYRKNDESLLDIILCSPSNSCSVLLNKKPSISKNGKNGSIGKRSWNFSSVHFWGENPTGNWFLLFYKSNGIDPQLFELGTVALTLFGTSINPSKVYNNKQDTEENSHYIDAIFNSTEWYSSLKRLVSVKKSGNSIGKKHEALMNDEASFKVCGIGLVFVVVIIKITDILMF